MSFDQGYGEQELIEQLLAHMRSNGVEIDEPLKTDGHIHRYHVAGDRRGVRNAWATIHLDYPANAEYGCNKRLGVETRIKWQATSKGGRAPTPDEVKEMKRINAARERERRKHDELRRAKAAERALALYEAAEPCETHEYLTAKGVPSSPLLRVGPWYRWNEEDETWIKTTDNALIIPVVDRELRIHSLQAIQPGWREDEAWFKALLKDGAVVGHFFPIGKAHDDTILICEGVATGLSIWQCTGHGVICAFNAGNLKAVAQTIRKSRPLWKILICADNDRWTTAPIPNPGLSKARDAALATSSLVCFPEFGDTSSKPTDFNDLHVLEGEAAVRAAIDAALNPMPIEEERALDLPTAETSADPAAQAVVSADPAPMGPSKNPHFMILGYNLDQYFIFVSEKRQVMAYTRAAFNDAAFYEIGDPNWWEDHFHGSQGGIDRKAAMNFIMRSAHAQGIFNPDRARGRGAWLDNARHVYHHGQQLTVDGAIVDVARVQSKYIYQLAPTLPPPADTPLSDAEGWKLLELAEKFRWIKPGSAPLLLGWVALAPFCGALRWRPHIWITGNAGSGKSTIMEQFVNPLLQGMTIYAQGNSSEAGIRQKLKGDALPVLIDENEQHEDRDVTRVQSILALMRQASTESQAQTFKGTTGGDAQHFHIRSMFCFCSIQVGMKHQADIERVSILTLRPRLATHDAAAQWETLKEQIHVMIGRDSQIHARLFRRMLDLLPTVIENISVFVRAAAKKFKSQRAGDQYGTLMAGAWGLLHAGEATEKDADFFLDSYDWSDYVEEYSNDEGERALQSLLDAHMRGPRGIEYSVYEVLAAARNRPPKGVDLEHDIAQALLLRNGMKLEGDHLMLSNTSNELRALLADTNFRADWSSVLRRMPGVDKFEGRRVRINGSLVSVTRVSLNIIFDPKEEPKPLYSKQDAESQDLDI